MSEILYPPCLYPIYGNFSFGLRQKVRELFDEFNKPYFYRMLISSESVTSDKHDIVLLDCVEQSSIKIKCKYISGFTLFDTDQVELHRNVETIVRTINREKELGNDIVSKITIKDLRGCFLEIGYSSEEVLTEFKIYTYFSLLKLKELVDSHVSGVKQTLNDNQTSDPLSDNVETEIKEENMKPSSASSDRTGSFLKKQVEDFLKKLVENSDCKFPLVLKTDDDFDFNGVDIVKVTVVKNLLCGLETTDPRKKWLTHLVTSIYNASFLSVYTRTSGSFKTCYVVDNALFKQLFKTVNSIIEHTGNERLEFPTSDDVHPETKEKNMEPSRATKEQIDGFLKKLVIVSGDPRSFFVLKTSDDFDINTVDINKLTELEDLLSKLKKPDPRERWTRHCVKSIYNSFILTYHNKTTDSFTTCRVLNNIEFEKLFKALDSALCYASNRLFDFPNYSPIQPLNMQVSQQPMTQPFGVNLCQMSQPTPHWSYLNQIQLQFPNVRITPPQTLYRHPLNPCFDSLEEKVNRLLGLKSLKLDNSWKTNIDLSLMLLNDLNEILTEFEKTPTLKAKILADEVFNSTVQQYRHYKEELYVTTVIDTVSYIKTLVKKHKTDAVTEEVNELQNDITELKSSWEQFLSKTCISSKVDILYSSSTVKTPLKDVINLLDKVITVTDYLIDLQRLSNDMSSEQVFASKVLCTRHFYLLTQLYGLTELDVDSMYVILTNLPKV